MTPNPNLWAVDIVDKKSGQLHISLWVCAPTVASAESKASRHAKKMGFRAFVVRGVAHKGEIDVF